MNEISRNGTLIKFDRVVAYGCSFTAGSELLDYLLAPKLTVEEIDAIKRSKTWTGFYEQFSNPKLWNYIRDNQSNYSWAKWFTNEFSGVSYSNRAVMGSSVAEMVYTIERDLHNGTLTDTDLILVGLTSPDRWMYFNNEHKPVSVIYGWPQNWPATLNYEQFIISFASDQFRLYNYFNSIKYLDMLSDRLNGRILQQFVHSSMTEIIKSSKDISDDLTEIVSTTEQLKSIIDHTYSFGKILNWNTDTHGAYHPKLAFHKQFGKHLAHTVKGN